MLIIKIYWFLNDKLKKKIYQFYITKLNNFNIKKNKLKSNLKFLIIKWIVNYEKIYFQILSMDLKWI